MNARKLVRATLACLCTLVGFLGLASAPALAHYEYVAGGKFGSEGSGKGQFAEPIGVAVNESTEPVSGAGDVYVADRANGRVERFSATGSYLGQFDGTGSFEIEGKAEKGLAAPAGQLLTPEWIAVDDSGKSVLEDPSVGDVYVADAGHKVVDKFSPTGQYLAQFATHGAGEKFGPLLGVAVDRSGDVLVYDDKSGYEPTSTTFSDSGTYLSERYVPFAPRPQPDGLAVDSSENLYAVASNEQGESELLKRPQEEIHTVAANVSAFAVDPASNEVFADKENTIDRYGPFGEPYLAPLEIFPTEGLSGSRGIGINGATGTVYASEHAEDDVAVFHYVLLPTASTEMASNVTETTATLNGTVETEGEAITECRFEYGGETSYGQSVPCQQTPAEINALSKGGTMPVRVSAKVTLQSRNSYDFRLDAADANGVVHGQNQTVYTTGHPTLEGSSLADVGSTEASVAAVLNPGGLPTTYRVEYGTNSVEEFATPQASAGSAKTPIDISVLLSSLTPEASYRLRFVASNSFGSVVGEELTFTTNKALSTGGGSTEADCTNRTFSGFEAALPDCRAYELVSNPIDDTYLPSYGEPGSYSYGSGEVYGEPGNYRAAADGERLAYMGGPSASGIGGSGKTSNDDGNHYLAVRGPGQQWEASNIEFSTNAEVGGAEFTDFSDDLSVETLTAPAQEVFGAQPEQLGDCGGAAVFSRTDSGLHALVGMSKSSECFGAVAGISADDSHILFASAGAYTAEADLGTEGNNLYDSVDGTVRQVNVLPNGQLEQDPQAEFGSEENHSNVINADGSRIFWTTHAGSSQQALYVRENDAQPQSPVANGRCIVAADACTVQLDAALPGAPEAGGGGHYWTASSDGSRVFFTDQRRLTASSTAASGEPDLYEYEVNGETGAPGTLTDLTTDGHAGEHANVQGVIGASEDGSYVYFVAEGVLAGANAEGRTPTAGQPNLYVSHGGGTTLVATLESRDNEIENYGRGSIGDWRAGLGTRSAEVSPGGHALGFMSRSPLTGYDSRSLPEVFLYEAGSAKIVCVSCSPTGAAPIAMKETAGFSGSFVGTSQGSAFTLRWINEREGLQVYFMSNQPLVPSDTNGLDDVYEWESQGSGNCRQTSGCIGLLSSASASDNAYFVDASADGADVFITSRAQLTATAIDETIKAYDVRVDGGARETSLACTGTGCQGAPPAPPIFATPSSVTFNGVGNFEPPTPQSTKVKPKKKKKQKAKCKRGFAKRHGRCVKQRKVGRSKIKSSKTGKGK